MISLAVSGALALAAQTPSLDAYTRLPDFEQAEVSADGRWLAFSCPTRSARRVCVADTEGGTTSLPIPDGVATGGFYFASNTKLVMEFGFISSVTTTAGRQTWPIWRALIVDLETKETLPMMDNQRAYSSNANVVSLLRDDPDHVLVELTVVREGYSRT